MRYVIQREDGAFVADMRKTGKWRSYTERLQHAKTFDTRESAERDRCPGNERILSVEDAMQG